MQLVIVESPTKARKLSGYLGKDFRVEASVGHIRDLPKSGLGVDEESLEPTYEVNADKKKVISKLKSEAKNADIIYLATDPDREGEAIAWHIQHVLENDTSLKKKKIEYKRATFHEITKTAVTKAIDNPSTINMDLVDAQQARRVLDRLVGYKVSPVLWKKVRRGLSAGRVQSVALRLLAEREREIEAFIPEEYWEVDVALAKDQRSETIFVDGKANESLPEGTVLGKVHTLNGKKFEPKKEADITDLQEVMPTAAYTISTVERKERKRQSLPPFTTSSLQQKAATSFGYSGKKTMQLAQNLYEEGLITYHRTDSTNLSTQATDMARDYILAGFGKPYLPTQVRSFSTKSKNAQEAHEAIRVTDISIIGSDIIAKSTKFSEQHVKIYSLIWNRYVASQMTHALYEQTAISIEFQPTIASATVKNGEVKVNGSILKFDGWTRLFPNREDVLLPEVSEGETLFHTDSFFAQKFTQPPSRYNDASLIKELEKRGIGRPSTYASIISVIVDRGYIERKEKRFFTTAVGLTVSDFLIENFPEFMEYEFTAEMEEDLDRIALGKKEWKAVVRSFYTPLSKKIEKVTDSAERKQIPVEETGEKCPKCGDTEGGKIVIRSGKFGKFKSCNKFPECKFTENINETVDGVKCPLCHEGAVIVKNSRWGKAFFGCGRYPDCDWADWKKPELGMTVTKEEWAKKQAERAERKKKWLESRAKKPAAKKTTAKKATAKKAPKKKPTKATK
ncbi:MAG: type I DNA topoisomerase [Candidatus Pacebacteria bacterium]|nr:type I DNA topoisomerase [Candidatus Paceibacterota bacterium]